MISLQSKLSLLPHVGPQYAKRLEAQGLSTVKDILWYLPFRYEDLRKVSTTQSYLPDVQSVFEGEIIALTKLPSKNGKVMVKGVFKDGAGELPVIWFNQPFILQSVKKFQVVRMIGKVQEFSRIPTLISPQFSSASENDPHTSRLVPIYSEFNGITTKWLRSRIWELFQNGPEMPRSEVPLEIAQRNGLIPLSKALQAMHFPDDLDSVSQARKRLAYEELFVHLLKMRLTKIELQRGFVAQFTELPSLEQFYKTLPFTLSSSQQQAIDQILDDVRSAKRLNRMLVGDVGSGKTVVAAAVMYVLAKLGKKSLLMAPTQILASQHQRTLEGFFSPHMFSVAELSGVQDTVSEDSRIVVGTHALLHREQKLNEVGLIVIDEQHRFGVAQRELLRQKYGLEAHFLTMSATPIPRSLALVALGHLEVSYLESRKDGRKPAITKVVPYDKRTEAYAWISAYLKERGGQVFVVCPFISQSESMESVKSAEKEFAFLQTGPLLGLRLALLHGAMNPQQKDQILQAFKEKLYDVLVTTPVVEVGIDIPDANFIVIESAERFGLAQLHQLRGRVGRAGQQSFCFLVPTSNDASENKRLKSLEQTDDGFALAETDLKYRGAGTILGTMQHGFAMFTFADMTDSALIREVTAEVERLVDSLNDQQKRSLFDQFVSTEVRKGLH